MTENRAELFVTLLREDGVDDADIIEALTIELGRLHERQRLRRMKAELAKVEARQEWGREERARKRRKADKAEPGTPPVAPQIKTDLDKLFNTLRK